MEQPAPVALGGQCGAVCAHRHDAKLIGLVHAHCCGRLLFSLGRGCGWLLLVAEAQSPGQRAEDPGAERRAPTYRQTAALPHGQPGWTHAYYPEELCLLAPPAAVHHRAAV
eukprot:COSAG05_NODE_5351_length_1199_cov_5.475347_2_plen_111_part_00